MYYPAILSLAISTVSIMFCSTVIWLIIKSRGHYKLLYLFAGTELAFLLDDIGFILGGLAYYIFPNHDVDPYYCAVQTYLRLSSIIYFSIFQILIDVFLYLNVFKIQIYVIALAKVDSIILATVLTVQLISLL